MAVKRIVANIGASDIEAAKPFYRDLLGMEVVMDMGWIVTFESGARAAPQLSVAVEGGSGTAVPDISIEVDALDDILTRMRKARVAIETGPVVEPWGVRRFFVRDPFGRLVDILSHTRQGAFARGPLREAPLPNCRRVRDEQAPSRRARRAWRIQAASRPDRDGGTTRILSMRRPSMSTTSNRNPSRRKASPVVGT